ncbi:MAG: cytochrome c biogenesis protein CcdA [Nitrospinota bacterium]|nr:MAG: cytochrome c biogenesis protein CcdA [Nitrospinota bacterium]
MSSVNLSLLVAMSAGLFSFLSPCVLPLFPSYLSFITGMSLEDFQGKSPQNRPKVILHSLLFILGFSIVFVSLGASFSALGSMLMQYQGLIRKLGGLLVIFFGLYITGVFKIPFLARYFQFQLQDKPAGYFGSLLVGFSFAIGWTPCVGPILGAILTLASTSGEVSRGMILLSAYSLGLGIPFFLSALAFNRFLRFFQQFRRYIQVVHVAGGVVLIVAGILLYTGYMTILNTYALQLTPEWLWKRL